MSSHSLILCFTIFIAFVSFPVLSQEAGGRIGGNVGGGFNVGAKSTSSFGVGDSSKSAKESGGITGNSGSKVESNGNVGIDGTNDAGSVGGGETNDIRRSEDSNQEGYSVSKRDNSNNLRTSG